MPLRMQLLRQSDFFSQYMVKIFSQNLMCFASLYRTIEPSHQLYIVRGQIIVFYAEIGDTHRSLVLFN